MLASRRRNIFLISVVSIFLVILIWFYGHTSRVSSPFPEDKAYPGPLRITGFSYVTQDKEELEVTMDADELRVNPRRFSIFSIKPFNEVILTNARLAVHLNEGESSKASLLSIGKDILAIDEKGRSRVKGMGLITRGIIEGLVFEIHKADTLSLVVTAKKAIIDFKKQEATLDTATIEDKLSHRLIRKRRLVWSFKDDVLNLEASGLPHALARVKERSLPVPDHEH